MFSFDKSWSKIMKMKQRQGMKTLGGKRAQEIWELLSQNIINVSMYCGTDFSGQKVEETSGIGVVADSPKKSKILEEMVDPAEAEVVVDVVVDEGNETEDQTREIHLTQK